MQTHNVEQGTDQWLKLRSGNNTASEAPCLMGHGKISRSGLLKMKATGTEQEFSNWTIEVLFEKGHEIEKMARPIAEKIVGEELYPVTGSDDGLLASFDGLTMCEDTCWECKQWNENKADDVVRGRVPSADYWQVQQQLAVSGASRCLYMVTDGTEEKCVTMWVEPNPQDIDLLKKSWEQFNIDLANYVPKEVVAEVVGRAPDELPALRLQVSGKVVSSNLAEFKASALSVFSGISTDLKTDEDFAHAEKAAKWCDGVEKKLEQAKKQALEQTASIDELFLAIDSIKEEARTKRLELTRLVKSRKESIRAEILNESALAVVEHMEAINNEFQELGVHVPAPATDFPGAMKNKRTITSLRDAAESVVAAAKVEADSAARVIRSNLKILAEEVGGYGSLFPDRQQLVLKAPDDLLAAIRVRVADHLAEQERSAQVAAAKVKAEAEAAARVKAPADEAQDIPDAPQEPPTSRRKAKAQPVQVSRPGADSIVALVAADYGVSREIASSWLVELFGQ